ncbi:MAG: hypothetical protein WBD20_06200 [Pirellulaceae bacterium]
MYHEVTKSIAASQTDKDRLNNNQCSNNQCSNNRRGEIQHSRRAILAASLAASCAVIAGGCKSEPEAIAPTTIRTDVPLRLLWVGSESDSTILKRKWEAVASQPLRITVVTLERSQCDGVIQSILDQHKSNDLIVYPLMAAASLTDAKALIPQADALLGGTSALDSIDKAGDKSPPLARLYPVLRNNASQFAGETIGLPLGANLPGILSAEPFEPLNSWADYDRWIDKDLGGAAAEPLTPGWVGQMFLWRAAGWTNSQWLFGSENLTPQINQDDFVAVLQQMLETSKRYKDGRQSPKQIWEGILSGKLRGGIGWEVPSEDNSTEITVSNLPTRQDTERVLLDPFLPIISISTGCRQSAAAVELLKWISAGEGSQSLAGQIPSVTATRVVGSNDTGARQQRRSQYQTWLRKRLDTPITLPTLQLLSGDQYYAALDSEIDRCLDGKSSVKESLNNVAAAWTTLNEKLNVKEQERAWRRAQGSRA